MYFDANSNLWLEKDRSFFFRDRSFHAIKQQGPHCVSTVLAMLTEEQPSYFQGRVNTQNPVSWSEALAKFGMKLAYCPTDARKLKHYMDELCDLDDLFTLSYYTSSDPKMILADPDERGWVTGSHIVVLHRKQILDPGRGDSMDANAHSCNGYHTKRVFRVVPSDHKRGL
jgi:hypothetical protein